MRNMKQIPKNQGHKARIRVKQVYFHEDHKAKLCREFEPFDNSSNPKGNELFEFGVMHKLFGERFHETADFTGVVSWRFEQKTGISAASFLTFVKTNPGADVYFINPFPQEELRFQNVWVQGEKSHPGLSTLADSILAKLGYPTPVKSIAFQRNQIAYSNYWVGNARFWNHYMQFMENVLKTIRDDSELRIRVFSETSYLYASPFFAFLQERMFSTFLVLHPEIASRKFVYPAASLISKYEQAIVGIQMRYEQSAEYELGWRILHRPWQIFPWIFRKLRGRVVRVFGSEPRREKQRIY